MTCGDVERLLDAFIDRELPAPMLLEVARHASACPPCDATLRQVATLGDLIGQTLADDAAALDLAPVWPAVARGIERSTRRRRWAQRLRTVPAWGVAAAALAASALLWLQASTPPTQRPVRVATARLRPDQAVIDRLAGKHVRVRSEPKAGMTMIWVDYPGEPAR
jgi:anti-sigma factor RsiW